MITTGYLNTTASLLAGKFLGDSHELPSDPALTRTGRDDEAGDPAEKTICVKKWDAVERQKPHHFSSQLSDKNRREGHQKTRHDSLLRLLRSIGISEIGQKSSDHLRIALFYAPDYCFSHSG